MEKDSPPRRAAQFTRFKSRVVARSDALSAVVTFIVDCVYPLSSLKGESSLCKIVIQGNADDRAIRDIKMELANHRKLLVAQVKQSQSSQRFQATGVQ